MTRDLEGITEALRRAMPPVRVEGPRRDLWPDVARRMSGRPSGITWLDWVAGASAIAASLAVPTVIPTLLYLL